MKFAKAFENELSAAVKLVDEVRDLCNDCGRLLSQAVKQNKHQGEPFPETAIQFTRINHQTIDCIKQNIKEGYLVEVIALLRWHLELSQLFYFLWMNPEKYDRWLAGEEMRPKEIGSFFKREGLATWQETYIVWSNVTHGNGSAIENCYNYARSTPVDADQVLLAGHALRNLMWFGHKINNVSGNLLKNLINVSEYNPIAKRYNVLEEIVVAHSNQQNEAERQAGWSEK